MSTSETNAGTRNKLYGLLAVAAVVAVAAGLMVLRPKPPSVRRDVEPGPGVDRLLSARETLYQGADLASCRTALQSINLHFSHQENPRPYVARDPEADQVVGLVGLDAGEVAEVNSRGFTALDGHHLDQCFLMRDAARALDVASLAPLGQAEAAFRWVVRQVRLQERNQYPAPPAFVLRRGWGTALERSFVFLALLKQLGIHGCVVACPRDGVTSPVGPWVAGALVGADIFLFDARLGLPLPGPHGRGVATLAQVRSRPDVLKQLTVHPKYPYDVTSEQAGRAELYLVCSLSGLAPRMKWLEDMLASSNPVSLTDDPARLLDKFRRAVGKGGTDVRFWARPGEPGLRLLRRFLPPEEGGIDQSRRQQRLEMELFPWDLLPAQVMNLPENVPPGQWLRQYFAELFEDFPVTAQLVAAQVNKQVGSDQMLMDATVPPQELMDDWNKRLACFFLTGAALQAHAGHAYTHFLLAPRTPRDHILRGRFGEATDKLVEALDQGRFQQEQAGRVQDLARQVAVWSERAQDAQLALQRAQDAAARGKATDHEALTKAQAGLLDVWPIVPAQRLRGSQLAIPLPPWLVLLLAATAHPITADAMYLLALCKHEQAEREQAALAAARNPSADQRAAVREAWARAAHWWKTYLDEYGAAPAAAAARALRAEALAALGEPAQAAGLLEDLSDNPPPLEKTARLYRARQLRNGQPAARAKAGAAR